MRVIQAIILLGIPGGGRAFRRAEYRADLRYLLDVEGHLADGPGHRHGLLAGNGERLDGRIIRQKVAPPRVAAFEQIESGDRQSRQLVC